MLKRAAELLYPYENNVISHSLFYPSAIMVTLTPEWMDPESLDMSMVGLDHILRILVSDEEFNDDVAAHNVQSHRLPSIDFHLQSRRALQESYMEVPLTILLKFPLPSCLSEATLDGTHTTTSSEDPRQFRHTGPSGRRCTYQIACTGKFSFSLQTRIGNHY